MKEDDYTEVPIDELLDSLSKRWGVPYGAEDQIGEYVKSLRDKIKSLEMKNL